MEHRAFSPAALRILLELAPLSSECFEALLYLIGFRTCCCPLFLLC